MAAAVVLPIVEGRAPSTLVEIVDHLEALFDTLDMVEEPEQKAEIQADIQRYLDAEIRKVDSIAAYLGYCEAQQNFAAEEIRRLQARKQTWERKEERLKVYIQLLMERTGVKKLEGRTGALSLRPCPASVEVLDASAVPETYKVVTVTESIDKAAVRAALKAGGDVPGVRLVTDRKSVVRQ